jgi:lipopolysaccharide transport system ATP-binding protein
MSDVRIKVENVSKKFCRDLKRSLWYGIKDLGSELACLPVNKNGNLRKQEFWSVKDISFELKKGECLGLIGPNGAGKTSLLRMLNGLIKPDRGRIEMQGRIGALIALGAGFNPILTGRENIYVNGAVLGLPKKEIDAKFDEIVDFAELDEFIDTPVQNYSSGMRVRLGFSIATALNPDILLVDEVLAVGDIRFILKCFNRIDSILSDTAVIFVSHSMPQIERICSKLIVLKKGEVIFKGDDVSAGINSYYELYVPENSKRIDFGQSELNEISLSSETNGSIDKKGKIFSVDYGGQLNIHLGLKIDPDIDGVQLILTFFDQTQKAFGAVYSDHGLIKNKAKTGLMNLKVSIPKITLSQGIYSITVACKETASGKILFRHQSVLYFQVVGEIHGWVPVIFPATWQQI